MSVTSYSCSDDMVSGMADETTPTIPMPRLA